MKRRPFLQSLAAALAAGPAWAQHEASPWRGPLDALRLPDTTGKTWTPADFRARAVLINVWASWCEPCRTEMPSLQTLADFHGPERLLVLAVNFKEAPARAQRYAQAAGLRLPVLLDTEGQLARRWDVKVFPSTFLIDRHGQPRLRLRGEVDWSGAEAGRRVEALLA